MEELGWEHLKRFVSEHEPGKMFHLLHYIFIGACQTASACHRHHH